jgi:hypothetical protein
VIFTDRKKWRRDVERRIDVNFKERTFLHFEYILVKLFDLNAGDYYHVNNPMIKVLSPKMNYDPGERVKLIRHAYKGLFELV